MIKDNFERMSHGDGNSSCYISKTKEIIEIIHRHYFHMLTNWLYISKEYLLEVLNDYYCESIDKFYRFYGYPRNVGDLIINDIDNNTVIDGTKVLVAEGLSLKKFKYKYLFIFFKEIFSFTFSSI